MWSRLSLRPWAAAVVFAAAVLGVSQLGQAAYIYFKAGFAQVLLQGAFTRSQQLQGEPVKPWPWADTWPVARLLVPSLDVDLLVLSGASGHALAFGPGHEIASARLLQPGVSVVGGHRDTHFSFLSQLHDGAHILLQLSDGRQQAYRVDSARVVDSRQEHIHPEIGRGSDTLLLVTCYPFDALRAGGPLRYAVTATALSAERSDSLLPTRPPGVYAL